MRALRTRFVARPVLFSRGFASAQALRQDSSAEADLTPLRIVDVLNRHIIGQEDAKKAVAVALRNRHRRRVLEERERAAEKNFSVLSSGTMSAEILPKNILMVGPTGSGKSEIVRRVSLLTDAPFVKVEATRYTEAGFHGKDVDTVISDLVAAGIQRTRASLKQKAGLEVQAEVEEKLLDALVGQKRDADESGETMREEFRTMLRAGELEETEVRLELPERSGKGGPQDVEQQVQVQIVSLLQNMGGELMKEGGGPKRRRVRIRDARAALEEAAVAERWPDEEIVKEALHRVEQSGIVVIDEIDKICQPADRMRYSADASAEGVQRDLLPLIEGTTVQTKHGNVNTSKILFIAAGAFHSCKPSDLLAELQGRLPIRVGLAALSEDDLYKVLTETQHNLIEQQVALLATEGLTVHVEPKAIREIARLAAAMNVRHENIGARRLHAVIEKVFEDVSFDWSACEGSTFVVTPQVVRDKMEDALAVSDLSRFLI